MLASVAAQRHAEAGRRQQAADDLVDALEQGRHVLRRVGRFGDRIQRRLHGLGLLGGGNVARHGHAQLVGFGPACRPHNMDDLAILAQVAVFKARIGLAVHDGPGCHQRAFAVGRRHQVDHLHADHFLRAVAENALARGADKHKAPARIDHADGIHQQVGEVDNRGGNSIFHVGPF